jgi:hypothetical protein
MKTLIIAVISIVWGSQDINFLNNTGTSPAQAYESLLKLKKYDDDPRPIRGTVRKPNLDPLPSAVVKLYNTGGTLLQTKLTNSSGFYEFNAVMPGTYQINADASGYIDSTVTFILTNVVDGTQNFILQSE